MVPWGGPTIRAATALEVPLMELYAPMVIPQICGLLAGLAICVMFGLKEKKRLGVTLQAVNIEIQALSPEEAVLRRPQYFWFNLLLIIVTVAALVSGILPPAGCFMPLKLLWDAKVYLNPILIG